MELKTFKEFELLIPPLSGDEYAQLEKNCIDEGIRDPLVVWRGYIIDGHNRYKISKNYDLEFNVVEKHFEDESDAKHWMISNQLGRRNLSKYSQTELTLELKKIIAEKAKENQGKRTDLTKDNILQNSAKGSIDTRKELARLAGVSHDTVDRVEKIKENAPEAVKEKLRAGELSINQVYEEIRKNNIDVIVDAIHDIQESGGNVTPSRVNEKLKAHVANNSGNNEWYTPKEYIDSARKVMGSIDLDPASSEIANKIVNAKTFYTKEDSGLNNVWFGNIWMNPPYAQPLITEFCEKIVTESYNQAIILVNNATETKWFSMLFEKASAVCFVRGRIRFFSPDGRRGDAPLQGQAIVYVGEKTGEFVSEFKQYGQCLFVAK